MDASQRERIAQMRAFQDKPAIRQAVPLLIGLVGASGSGKTFSALRLAAGMSPDAPIYVIDTEARRSLWYADKFKFQHIDFQAPFGSLDYLAAIQHCVSKGARTIIIDSQSHEHEGVGGVLEFHETEAERLSKAWGCSRDKANMSAWAKPKSQRRQLLNTILQMPINFIFCFRAKEKIDLKGPKPKTMGWMPIAGEEFIYEQTLNCLLMPNAGGVPSWQPEEMGEKAIIKLPEQFKSIFAKQQPLSEEIGQKLAAWARGGKPAIVDPLQLPGGKVENGNQIHLQREAENVPAEPTREASGRIGSSDSGSSQTDSDGFESATFADEKCLSELYTKTGGEKVRCGFQVTASNGKKYRFIETEIKGLIGKNLGKPMKVCADSDGFIADIRPA